MKKAHIRLIFMLVSMIIFVISLHRSGNAWLNSASTPWIMNPSSNGFAFKFFISQYVLLDVKPPSRFDSELLTIQSPLEHLSPSQLHYIENSNEKWVILLFA